MRLETLRAFLQREKFPLLMFGGIYCLLMIVAVIMLDPAYFYPRLQTDPLNYYLKAQALLQTGSTTVAQAVNQEPFAYASMPGLLRLPALFFFSEFDSQLKAMQVINIPIVASIAVMSAYILSWCHPVKRHALIIALAFAFTLFSPIWLANVFLPLADAPYAAFSLATILATIGLLRSRKPLSAQILAIAGVVLLFSMAFALRFTAPALLVFGGILMGGAHMDPGTPRRPWKRIALTAAGILSFLVVMNFDAIVRRYLFEPLYFLERGDKPGMLLNLLGVAVPSQIIPNFASGFVHPPITAFFLTSFGASIADTAWLLLGLGIAAVTIAGLWLARRQFLPEIAYVIVPLPILALVLPSAARYMMSYQPFVWLFFSIGAAAMLRAARTRVRLPSNAVLAVSLGFIAATGVVGLRIWRLAGSTSERQLAVSVTQMPSYISDVSTTFRRTRAFLESLPAEKTLLIGDRGTTGRWKAISDRDYYVPDSGLASVVRYTNVYVLAECGTVEVCVGWKHYESEALQRVETFGDFEFDSVFAAESPRARVKIFRVRPSGEAPPPSRPIRRALN